MHCCVADRCATQALPRHLVPPVVRPDGLVTPGHSARRFVVSGKVQGVFFRASTARMAEQFGLRGYARNLPDGRVEVLALGDPASLVMLAGWLRQGPTLARVIDVIEQEEDVTLYADVVDFRTR